MLDHISITVDDMAAAGVFYDAVMGALGYPRVGASQDWIGYGLRAGPEHPQRSYLSIRKGQRPELAQARHWCFKAPSRTAVDEFFSAGIAAGGRDDGVPGVRAHYHASYYAAFLVDPAGNRVEAVCHAPGEP